MNFHARRPARLRATVPLLTMSVAALLSSCGGSSQPSVAMSVAPGSATVSWSTPSQNTDGTSLTDLSGYRIYYGTDPGNLSTVVGVTGTSTLSQTVNGLATGTYYFAVSTLNRSGTESDRSNLATISVQ